MDRLIAPALDGTYSAEEAVRTVTNGTGLQIETRDSSILVRDTRSPPPNPLTDDVVVTGTRIKGAKSASETITISRDAMINSGLHTLSDVVQTIPQNFGGGQNPGVAFNVPTSSGENIGGGTSINLRGLGQDATLTLVNGQRLVYGGYRQSVDVGSIPLLAVDRLEIVPDGTSAIYGSDAVAGVANIILRPDYSGVIVSAQLGAATEGGDRQQQYAVLAGTKWSGGGMLAAYEFGRSTAIDAAQRSYAAVPNKGLTLYPFLKHHDALITVHHEVAAGLEAKIDAFYNWRADDRGYAISSAPTSPSYRIKSHSWMAAISPSLQWALRPGWTVNLVGTYGVDRSYYGNDLTSAGVTAATLRACFCNASMSAELNAQGALASLPAGDLKIALGGGARKNDFHAYRSIGQAQNIQVSQSSSYLYAEAEMPLAAPGQNIALVDHASITAALRYERYPGVDSVATPKLGAIYAPSRDIEFKATWGKSFKAPTLFQRYSDQGVLVTPAASRGGVGFPATATVLYLYGGQPDLKAERATTWSASMAVSPRPIPGLRLEISYFRVNFIDRVVAPISIPAQSLSNPAYAGLNTLNPGNAQIADALAGRLFYSYVPGAFDPSAVVAIIDNRNRNVAAQHVQGLDVSAVYKIALGRSTSLTLSGNGSYLDSSQEVLAGTARTQLAGTYFNPPHFRGRAGAQWSDGAVNVSGFVNYIGGSEDTRYPPAVHIGSMATLDLAARYQIRAGRLGGLELNLSVFNLFDRYPPQSRSGYIFEPTYDSTNYSPVGRFISFGVMKKW
ncbi:TonB-dependent receptor [Sphingomonas sp. QA11]|uniref:TonB-dependent receptor plug domain-containing protein n=1 Tax=Sphingomonas sp. QA11 TaxID=2950605 RepID=UPI00234BA0F6|nr:TonB-dependent receptor [Sphingomonas sp. QA11]WCM25929.1 TonB-dependent receptor [Sphingomonas sp. QA11]